MNPDPPSLTPRERRRLLLWVAGEFACWAHVARPLRVARGSRVRLIIPARQLARDGETTTCHAGRDGECGWWLCPQLRDDEPQTSDRPCPLWRWERELREEW